MTRGAEWSDDTIVDRWSRLGIEPHTFELDANGTIQSRLHGGGRTGDTVIEALAPFERAQLALKGEIKLGREIGRGGLAVVRSATQRSLGRDVAVKQTMTDDQGAAYRLVREARILAALDHPNIIPVHMLGVDEGDKPLMVMKRVDGIRWREYVGDDGTLRSPEEGDTLEWHLRTLMAVCQVAQYAHAYGIIHRDLKLENIMIGSLGEVYVVDWDLALAVDPTLPLDIPLAEHEVEVLGTPEYMAPEMALVHAHELGPRTDVYLLGACLHTLLTGGARHQAQSVIARVYQAARSEPVDYPEKVPRELALIANKATSADPKERYSSADAFRNALVEFLAHRASLRLSEAAGARLSALEALVGTKVPNDAYRLQLLVGECRFGFRQALDEWPDNPNAAAGLRRVRLGALKHALETEDLSRAEVLMGELDDPPETAQKSLRRLKELRDAPLDAAREAASGIARLKARVSVGVGMLWILGLTTISTLEPASNTGAALPLLGVFIAMQALLVAVVAVRFGARLEEVPRGGAFLKFIAMGSWMPVILWPAMATLTAGLFHTVVVIQAALCAVFLLSTVLFLRQVWTGGLVLLVSVPMSLAFPSVGLEVASVSIALAYGLIAWRWWRVGARGEASSGG